MKKIIIKGAKVHNLKNVDLELPRDKFIVFTGVSGSGKSSLAFDTIFAEGQRRYLESLSAYARQFLGQMEKPEVDLIEGLSPTIAIDQKTSTHNPRSTVGTVTEIHDYLRLLYAKVGTTYCPKCSREIVKLSTEEIVDKIFDLGTSKEKNKDQVKVEILSPVIRDRKGEYLSLLNELFDKGYSKAYIDGELWRLEDCGDLKLSRYKKHNIDVVTDTLEVNDENITRLFEAVEKALKLSEGLVRAKIKEESFVWNQQMSCPEHDIEFPVLEPRLFSFNSPYGACKSCEGLGSSKEIDVEMLIPDFNKTVAEGAIMPWTYKRNNYNGVVLKAVMEHFNISENKRLKDLPEEKINLILYGREFEDKGTKDTVKIKYHFRKGKGHFNMTWNGLIKMLEDRYRKTESDAVRRDIEKYMSRKPCPSCKGSRFREEVLWTKIGGKNVVEVSKLSITDCLEFFKTLELTNREKLIADRILKEIIDRLSFLDNVGLSYLDLHRAAFTLSGGETQRIRLASQIGSQLVGVLYILDEPSIGLHARDNTKLLETLKHLKSIGNTLIVIEHDEETMMSADWLVDVGPRAGEHGGQIVSSGPPSKVLKDKNSLTAKYLTGKEVIETPKFRRKVSKRQSLIVKGACENNLKNIDVMFPLRGLLAVTGVSGSGKSTLVEDILYKKTASKIMRTLDKPGKHHEIDGMEYIDKVILMDQSPIGRTPRSNPATYIGLFTSIRELFSKTKAARERGYLPGRFSFNVDGGRCENCKGDGYLKIEMQFMADVYLPCDVCKGKRYNSETLQVEYRGKNIYDVLEMTVAEGAEFFSEYKDLHKKLKLLDDVGLGYIKLGQSATTLSGGEAQRVKLASELSKRATGNTLYVLDEPTTGLHFDDVKKLLDVVHRLVDAGNTVVVIEHNMDVIKNADWIIDMGPEGGEGGGKVVVSGTPEEVIKYHKESYTAKYLREVLKGK